MPESPTERTHDETVDIVRDCYDRIADDYLAAVRDHRHGDPRDRWTSLLATRLPAGALVLDVGCGPGVPTAAALAASGHRVHGIDVSPRQIELAREHVPQGRFDVADIARCDDFDRASFDAIVALYSLTHVPRGEYASLFARLASWLRSGGWFLGALGRSDSAGFDEVDFLGFEGTRSFTNSFTVEPTLELLRDAGFVVVEHALVDDDTPFGAEQWLWVLARVSE